MELGRTVERGQAAILVRRAIRPLLVSAAYLGLFITFTRLTTGLPDIGSWNLIAGLSFGMVLGYGLAYAPAVLIAHVFVGFSAVTMQSGAWNRVIVSAVVTAVYVIVSQAIRKLGTDSRSNLTDRRTMAFWLLSSPLVALLLAGAIVLNRAYLGFLSWNDVEGAVLKSFAGNICGILLITPLITLSRDQVRRCMDRISRKVITPVNKPNVRRARFWRETLVAVLLGVSAGLYFIMTTSVSDGFSLFCLLSLPLIALSFVFGVHGAAGFLAVLGVLGVSKGAAGSWTDLYSVSVIVASAINGIVVGVLVSERNQQQTAMDRQAGLLNSVSFATEQLLGMRDQEKNVNDVLRQLAAESGASHIYVLENREEVDSAGYPVVYECSTLADFEETIRIRFNAVRSKHIRLNSSALAEDKALQFRTADLADDERLLLMAADIHVGIILPIFADGRWWGSLGLDRSSTDQQWSETEVRAFKATAHVLGALLAHANVEQQFRQFTGHFPAVFWIAAPDMLHKTYVSPAYEQIWGRPCESIYEKPTSWIGAVYHEDYARLRETIDMKQGGEYDEEYRIVRPNREVRWIRDTAFPVRDASGQVSRVVGIAQDITPQKEAEERLRANSILLSTLIDNLPVGIVVEDHSRQVMHINPAFCEMFDVAEGRGTLAGMDSRHVLKQQHAYDKRMDQIIQAGAPCRGEELVLGDGRVFTRNYIPLLVDGDWHHHLWQYEDITERKQNEEQIRRSLTEKEVLLKEIHHRVKNNLQIISSLINLQSAHIRDHQTAQLFKDSQNRVRAMALVHERLYQSADLARIDFAGYVQDITNHLVRSYQTSFRSVNVKVEVDRISFNIDTAIPCALIIHELVSNALKYAFPDGRPGQIRVRLAQGPDEALTLVISDNGVGFPANVSMETTDSLGLQLVRSLTEQLKGNLQYQHDKGTEFHIKFRPVHERKPALAAG
jgi:PAS domain S-box-containing protein